MRRDANMSKRRGTSIAVATLCLFAIGIAPHLAEQSVGATLSERWSSLRGAFKKDSSPSQTNQSSSRNTPQRTTRTSYGKTRQLRRTAANNHSSSQQSPTKKSGLSSLIPDGLFGKEKSSQTANDNRQQQQGRQQQASSQNRNSRSNAQVANQKRKQNVANTKSQLASDLPQVVEDRKPAANVIARKSPNIDRRDELQEALTDLMDNDDLLPGSVIVDSEETVVEDEVTPAPGAAVLALDDYGTEIIDDGDADSDFADATVVEEPESLVVEDDASIAEEFVEDEATVVQTPAVNESYDDTDNLPIPEQTPNQDYSVVTQDDAEYAVVEEETIYEPSSQEVADVEREEVPFGQSEFDVHDALLSEDLYAMPEETDTSTEPGAVLEEDVASNEFADAEQFQVDQFEAELDEPSEALASDAAEVEEFVAQPELETEEPFIETPSVEQAIVEPAPELEVPVAEDRTEVAVDNVEPETEEPVASVDAFASISDLAADSQSEPQEVIASDSRYAVETQPNTLPGNAEQSTDQFADVVEALDSQSGFAATNPMESSQQESSRSEGPAKVASQPVQQTKPQPKLVRQDIKSAPKQKVVQREQKQVTRLIRPHGDVLTSTEQPVIMSHVEGPRSILVGKEASYRVVLENTSQTEAQNLSASVKVPEWADLVDVVCSAGIVEQSRDGNNSDTLQWHLPKLGAHASQTMQLQLIPRSGRAFQLGVQWKQETAATETVVQVKEAKLQMAIEGPEDVLFGDPKRYRLVLKNPGNGPAENVALTLIPPGSDSISAKPHVIGTLGPSEVKEIEIELTARETGELILQANAEASGDLKCEVIKRVQCRKPELEVDWRGPEQKYAGTESTYYFRVHNPGSARTGAVDVKVRLPAGIKFLSASDSFSYDATSGLVTWRLEGLRPSEEQFMQFRCELERPGLKEFEVEATSQGGLLSDAEYVRTEVIALADLKLDVSDPRGAHPTGEPVTYEIRVENRGTTDAEGISIVGLFSEGIDPVSVEGAQSSVRDGRVNFQTVKTLPPGGEILLKIRAIASDVGTHIFRAEVTCHDLDIKLAAEETTRFFKDDFQWGEGETPYTASRIKSTRSR